MTHDDDEEEEEEDGYVKGERERAKRKIKRGENKRG